MTEVWETGEERTLERVSEVEESTSCFIEGTCPQNVTHGKHHGVGKLFGMSRTREGVVVKHSLEIWEVNS